MVPRAGGATAAGRRTAETTTRSATSTYESSSIAYSKTSTTKGAATRAALKMSTSQECGFLRTSCFPSLVFGLDSIT